MIETITPRALSVFNIDLDLDALIGGPKVEMEVEITTYESYGDIVILWGAIVIPCRKQTTRIVRFKGSQKFCDKMLDRLSNDLDEGGADYKII